MGIASMETFVTLNMKKLFALTAIAIYLAVKKRHPKICNWYQQYGRCKFTSFCKFKHVNNINIDELMKRIEENAIKLCEINKALEAISKEEEATKTIQKSQKHNLQGSAKN